MKVQGIGDADKVIGCYFAVSFFFKHASKGGCSSTFTFEKTIWVVTNLNIVFSSQENT